jgi:hypothetical protein
MWERIVTKPTSDADYTTWLKLAETGDEPERVWHVSCAPGEEDRT